MAGLVHEVVWAKQLTRLIGATAHAQAAVLCLFMGGLAVGAVLAGRLVDRQGRPLRTYVRLEVMIGVYCLLIPLLLEGAGQMYVVVAGRLFESSGLLLLLRFALTLLVVITPALLMGATLPVMARHLIDDLSRTQHHVARLYALNSAGAVLGAGIAGFVLLPAIGVVASLVVAASLNFAAAALVLPLARHEAAPDPRATTRPALGPGAPYTPTQYRGALVALALSGFAAMGYEVIFLRLIALAFGSSAYSFTVMLMCFITGIALGAGIVSRLRIARPLWWLGVSQLLVVGSLLATTPLVSRLPYLIGLLQIALQDSPYGFEVHQAGKALLCLATLLLPAACLGMGFPLVAQVQARRPEHVGTQVGATYAWNTAGNVLGVAVTTLVFIPSAGVLGAFHWTIALNALGAMLLLVVASEARSTQRASALLATALVGAIYLAGGTGWAEPITRSVGHLRATPPPAALAADGSTGFETWKRRYVLPEAAMPRYSFEEDEHVTVIAYGPDPVAGSIRLSVNAKVDASTVGDLEYQMLLGHAPMFLAPQARSVLMIGHGSGITAGSALRHPVERADVVEISRAVLNADRLFAEHNQHVLSDPRVRVYRDDGQSFLRVVPRAYDVIISGPSNPWIAGNADLFTVEFYETVRAKLNPGGVFAFWFQTYEQSDDEVALVLRTVAAVFPFCMLFADRQFLNVIGVAAPTPLEPDFAAMLARFRAPAIRADLARLGVPNLAALLTHQRVTLDAARPLGGPGPVNTLGHQRLEYAAARSFFDRRVSFLLESVAPLHQGSAPPADVLLDGYLAHRRPQDPAALAHELRETGDYVTTIEGYGDELAASVRKRLEWISTPLYAAPRGQ
jgi:spermidine synthase